MALTANGQKAPIKAKLLIDMMIGSPAEQKLAGDIVELSHREFTYLKHFGRVEEAPAKPAESGKGK